MRTAAQLIAKIAAKTQEASITDAEVLLMINDAILAIAHRVRPASLVVSFAEVEIDDMDETFPMPDDFLYPHILSAFDADKRPVLFSTRTIEAEECFKSYEGTASSSVKKILFSKDSLRVFPKQSGSSIVYVSYVSRPGLFESLESLDTSVLDFLPEPYGEKAVIHKVCMDIYEDVEDGIGDNMENFKKHAALYEASLKQIEDIIGMANRQDRPAQVAAGMME